MTDPLESHVLFRASFPLRRYFYHRATGTELLFGADCFLLNRKREIPCAAIPDLVAVYRQTPLGIYVAPGEFDIVNLILGKQVIGGASIPASRVREAKGRVFFESAKRLYELCFTGPASYPMPELRFVSESQAEIDHWLADTVPDAAVLESGIAARVDGVDLIVSREGFPDRVIENALPAGTRLYTDGGKMLVLDGNTLKHVKTRREER